MDAIRFTYETSMRLVEGQPGVPVRWLKCRAGAKPLPFDHRMGSRVWEDDWRGKEDTGEFGEIYGLRPKWVPRAEPPGCPDAREPYWPTAYRPGVRSTDAYTFPALRTDAQGWPLACCGPAEFVPLLPACQESPLKRLPHRFWLKFSPAEGALSSCWHETTYLQMDWQTHSNRWYGAANPGFRNLDMEAILDPNDIAWGPCRIRMIIHFEGGPPGTLGLALIPLAGPLAIVATTLLPNPPYAQWLQGGGFGFNNASLCDLPNPESIHNIELITSPPS